MGRRFSQNSLYSTEDFILLRGLLDRNQIDGLSGYSRYKRYWPVLQEMGLFDENEKPTTRERPFSPIWRLLTPSCCMSMCMSCMRRILPL